jgi:hypothetical protein
MEALSFEEEAALYHASLEAEQEEMEEADEYEEDLYESQSAWDDHDLDGGDNYGTPNLH